MEMKEYIGVKLIKAIPMTKANAKLTLNQTIRSHHKQNHPGYLVEYTDGYQAWSPADVFEEAYRLTNGMNFGLAIEAMKKGYKVARAGWNGKDMFIYYVAGTCVHRDKLRGACAEAVKYAQSDSLDHQSIGGHIDMMAVDGSIVVGWLASQSDMLADDFYVVD